MFDMLHFIKSHRVKQKGTENAIKNELSNTKTELELLKSKFEVMEKEKTKVVDELSELKANLNVLKGQHTVVDIFEKDIQKEIYKTQAQINQTILDFKSTQTSLKEELDQTKIELLKTKSEIIEVRFQHNMDMDNFDQKFNIDKEIELPKKEDNKTKPAGAEFLFKDKVHEYSYSYYKVKFAPGVRLLEGSVADTCEAVGMKAVCAGPTGCAHNSERCIVTPLETSCTSPMRPLSNKYFVMERRIQESVR